MNMVDNLGGFESGPKYGCGPLSQSVNETSGRDPLDNISSLTRDQGTHSCFESVKRTSQNSGCG